MAGITEILNIVNSGAENLDSIRKRYLRELSEYTGRNTIAYYSGWLNKQGAPVPNLDINDSDMTGFMETVRGLDCEKGLDLILHTPGGDPMAAESIVKYLRSKFKKNIRIIVPHLAMSAGTMIACSGKCIVMGKHSSLGPIDPQLSGIPAYNIKQEFEQAKDEITNNPKTVEYWKIQLEKYPAAFLNLTIRSIELSEVLVKEWLGTCMFDAKRDSRKINKIVKGLNENKKSKFHGRHLDFEFCRKLGLKVDSLEEDQEFQDKVLSIHHAMTITFSSAPIVVKIIENNAGGTMIYNFNVN